jgi:predicted protein tyrosine phosphatase
MTIVVCPLHEVETQFAATNPARVISILAPDQEPPEIVWTKPLTLLKMHDLTAPSSQLLGPCESHIEGILKFGREWREPEPMLIHCWMGISRSTAAALILACAVDPLRDEADAARALRAASPTATPNPLMIALADARLNRQGRLIAAAQSIGRGTFASHGKSFRLRARSRLI